MDPHNSKNISGNIGKFAAPIQLARSHDNAVPISFIVRTGYAPLSKTVENHSLLDLKARNASGVRALEDATARALATMQADPSIQALLAQPTWGRGERVAYESQQAHAVAQAFRDDPLLATYRSPKPDVVRTEPQDLTNLLQGDEFDCDKMAIMKGIAISRIEAALLPGSPGSFKSPREYYVVGGTMRLVGDGKPADLHAALISSATGNMIEPTMNREPYFAAKHFSFVDYLVGRPFIAEKELMIKGQSTHLEYQMGSLASSRQQMVQRATALDRNDFQGLRDFIEPKKVTVVDFEAAVSEAHRWNDALKTLDQHNLTLEESAPKATTSPSVIPSKPKQPELRSR